MQEDYYLHCMAAYGHQCHHDIILSCILSGLERAQAQSRTPQVKAEPTLKKTTNGQSPGGLNINKA